MFFGAHQDVLVHLPNNKKQEGFFILFQHFIQGVFLFKRLKNGLSASSALLRTKTPPAFC